MVAITHYQGAGDHRVCMYCIVVGGRSSEGASPVRGGLGRASPIVLEFSDGGVCVLCELGSSMLLVRMYVDMAALSALVTVDVLGLT